MKNKVYTIILCLLAVFVSPIMHASNIEVYDDNPDNEITYSMKKDDVGTRFAIGGGYARRLGKLYKSGDSNLDEISKGLRNGFNIDMDMQYFLKKHWGLGLACNYVRSSASSGHYHEIDNLFYLGPTFSTRQEFGKFLFLSNIGFGMILLKADSDKNRASFGNNSLEKVKVGYQASLAIEYKIWDKMAVGLKTGVVLGTMKMPGIDERVSLSHLSIGGYVSFRSW